MEYERQANLRSQATRAGQNERQPDDCDGPERVPVDGEWLDFGSSRIKTGEYYRHASHLATFSQSVARYAEVRDNNFAFASAYKQPNYLRVQLEKARDFATLRNPNQLLQSEGFNASFFFGLMIRGKGIPDAELRAQRRGQMLETLADILGETDHDAESPFLLHFVAAYMKRYPAEAGEIADLLVDLSHGVFVDPGAASLWRRFYLAALTLDIRNLPRSEMMKVRKRWRSSITSDPQVLFSRLGPQLVAKVAAARVRLVAFGTDVALSFDLDTVQEGILRLIPEITTDDISAWLRERAKCAFQSVADFDKRVLLNKSSRNTLDI